MPACEWNIRITLTSDPDESIFVLLKPQVSLSWLPENLKPTAWADEQTGSWGLATHSHLVNNSISHVVPCFPVITNSGQVELSCLHDLSECTGSIWENSAMHSLTSRLQAKKTVDRLWWWFPTRVLSILLPRLPLDAAAGSAGQQKWGLILPSSAIDLSNGHWCQIS